MRFLRLWPGCAAVVFAAALCGSASFAHADASIPLPTFFANDDIGAARLSPSGRYLALAVPATSGRMVLAVVTIDSEKPPVVVASSGRADVQSFEWVNDERLVFNITDLRSAAADQGFGPGLFSVKRDGSEMRQLIRMRWDAFVTGTNIASTLLEPNHFLLHIPVTRGNEVIVGQVHFDNLGNPLSVTPKRLDVTTGRAQTAWIGYPSGALGWVFEPEGEPRAAATTAGGTTQIYWRDVGANAWRSLYSAPTLDVPWTPLAVDGAERFYVLAESAGGGSVLKRFDFKTGAPEEIALLSTPGFDARPTLLFADREQKRLVGFRVDTDAETTIWLDPDRKKLQEMVDARFPGRVNRISCSDDCLGDGAALVESYSDRDPGTFSIYRPSTRTWTTIGSARRAVDPRQMATLDLHRIKARDGLDLPVWVTTPPGKSSTPRPAVVLVHGGPWLRGTEWKWNDAAQFLASRGYVVIEPEFRGSEGFGQRHLRAGFKKWGTAMQDDVADAVRWAAEKGIVDAKRVCIAGASYGGYATLMGAILYPDLYRCGVAWVAVTDPRLLFEETWASDMTRELTRYSMPVKIGDPVKDAEMLKAAAPVERAKEIKIPMLMAFGLEDHRVPIDHGRRMRSAMQAAGQQPEYVTYEGEGHGWRKVENRIDFWTRVEKFLAMNLN